MAPPASAMSVLDASVIRGPSRCVPDQLFHYGKRTLDVADPTAQTMVASSVTIGRPYALRTQSRMTPLAPDEIIERFNPVTVWLTVKRPFECDPIEVQIDKSDILD